MYEINPDRFAEITAANALPFFLEEKEVQHSLPDGVEYYEYIISNIELDKSNPKNSYIMYLVNKVDQIDLTKPCAFTGRATALPDIDVDFPTDYRDKAIAYVRAKYGPDKVCQIATFGRLSGRSAIKAVMRADGQHDMEAMNAVTEFIPDEAAISDQLEDAGEESIISWMLQYDPEKISNFCRIEDGQLVGDYADVFRKAMALEGIFQNQGKHAAGVIISSEKISDVSPLCLAKDGSRIAALDMGDLEKMGLVKFDFLGVDILNKIQEAFGLEILNVPLDDEEVWGLLQEGNTKGCFQVESHLGKEWCMQVKPECIEDLAAISAIIRPGTLLSKHEDGRSMTKVFADRKNGLEPVEDTPVNKIIDTYGVLIYQETLLKIAKQLAGFNSAESIKLMKSVGKKDAKLLFSLEQKFVDGCKKVGLISEEVAKSLFDNIRASSRYLFNASHAVSYAFPGYWSAYIKKHKPLEFYKTWLKYSNHKLDPHTEVRNLVLSARMDDVEIFPPSCKYLTKEFFIKDDGVVFGLSHIKGASDRELDKLFELMKVFGLTDITTYLTCIFPKINKRTVEALINCGAFSFLGVSRASLLHAYECFSGLTDKELAFFQGRTWGTPAEALVAAASLKKEGGACSTKTRIPKVLEIAERLLHPGRNLLDTPTMIATLEENLIGIPLSCSYMDQCLSQGIADTTCREYKRGKPGKVTLVARIKEVKEHVLKNEKKMAFLTIEDDTTELDNVVCFAEQYDMYHNILFEGAMVSIFGERGKKGSLVVNRVVEL
jgi:DNA polymerase III alpha subunit